MEHYRRCPKRNWLSVLTPAGDGCGDRDCALEGSKSRPKADKLITASTMVQAVKNSHPASEINESLIIYQIILRISLRSSHKLIFRLITNQNTVGRSRR